MALQTYFETMQKLRLNIGTADAIILNVAHELQKRLPGSRTALRKVVWPVKSKTCAARIHVRLATSDRDVLPQIFVEEEYQPVSDLKDIRTIVDCGANIGLASVYLLERYPQATVLAMEADPENAAMCKRNLEGFGPRATVEQIGIWTHGTWEEPARLRLERNAAGREWGIAVRECAAGEAAQTFGVRMEAICQRVGPIDLLKMDIEGTEALLFHKDCDRWLPFVRNLAIEFHDEGTKAFAQSILTERYATDLSERRESVFAKNIRPLVASTATQGT